MVSGNVIQIQHTTAPETTYPLASLHCDLDPQYQNLAIAFVFRIITPSLTWPTTRKASGFHFAFAIVTA